METNIEPWLLLAKHVAGDNLLCPCACLRGVGPTSPGRLSTRVLHNLRETDLYEQFLYS